MEITIKGQLREYLFKPDVLDIDVTSSDGLLNYESKLFDNYTGEINDYRDSYVDFIGSSYSNADQISILIYFSPNLNRWMFEVKDWTQHDSPQSDPYLEAIYLASTEEFDTTQSVIEYFTWIFPFG